MYKAQGSRHRLHSDGPPGLYFQQEALISITEIQRFPIYRIQLQMASELPALVPSL